LSFVVILCWVFITVLIPYLRSLWVIPMLVTRYTIVILPAILLALAYGIVSFRHILLQWLVASFFVILSLIYLLYTYKYYGHTSKTQFREMTRYIVDENIASFPIINEKTHWHQQYYLKKFNSKAALLPGKKESMIDSILAKSSAQYMVDGFWIAGAHGDPKPDPSVIARLDSTYLLLKQKDFYDAWAMLYVLKETGGKNYLIIRHDQFEGGPFLPGDFVALYNGSIRSRAIPIQKGKYRVVITSRADPGGGQYPHVNVYLNNKKEMDYFLSNETKENSFVSEIDADDLVIKIEMDNDFSEPGKGDRNAFIQTVILERLN
ncbi:MAG TPA: hypothetical protein VF476_15710, partial [Chitinophagaceae bacterium]